MTMPYFRHLFFFIVLLLAGCAGQQSHETVEGHGDPALWQTHKTQLSTLDAWQIEGKVAIRSAEDSASGSVFWLQRQDYFDIRISGPMGQGASRLTGRPGLVELEVANQGRFKAATPEALLEQQLGWRLPVSHLSWWIRGLPAPDNPSQIVLDDNSRLARLRQDGWVIEYSRYALHNDNWLPERIKMVGHDLDITFVIKSWQPRRMLP